MHRGAGCTKDLQAEKHDLFEELKEVHSGECGQDAESRAWRGYDEQGTVDGACEF